MSLVPSVTETLVRWEVPPVACTRFCEQPGITQVGGTKNPDVAAIARMAPDLVVMCEEENRREDAVALAEAGMATAALAIDTVDDVVPAMTMLAGLVGVEGTVVERLSADLDLALGRDAAGTAARAAPVGARAFVPIWRRPWMTLSAATYGSSLLAALGVVNVFGPAGDRYPEVTLEEAGRCRPDVVLVPSEPYSFRQRHIEELARVAPVVPVDGQDLFWWGVRTPSAVDRLGSALRSALG